MAISQDNIDTWPEEGVILEMTGTPTISTTIDRKAEINLPIHDDISDNLLGNRDDQGPDPLRNTVLSTDTYEVVVDVLDTRTSDQ